MAALAGPSTASKRIVPIHLGPSFGSSGSIKRAYHALHHPAATRLDLGSGAALAGGDNGSQRTQELRVTAQSGERYIVPAAPSDEHECVLLFDEASQSYTLHMLSSVSQVTPTMVASTSGSPSSARVPQEGTYSPALISRTPQSANSPSVSASTAKKAATASNAYLSPASASTATVKKASLKTKSTKSKAGTQVRDSGHFSSPSPSPQPPQRENAAFGLGISTAQAAASPSVLQQGRTATTSRQPTADVEEFDMTGAFGSEVDDLMVNALELPPARASLPVPSPSSGANGKPTNGAPARSASSRALVGGGATSSSLSMYAHKDVVMSESESDDAGDFDDLANDLESSLVGQGPFARGAGGRNTAATTSSDDDDDDMIFVDSSAAAPSLKPSLSKAAPADPAAHIVPQQPTQSSNHASPVQQRPPPTPQSVTNRAGQASKRLPPPKKYDSDIASSSESDSD